MLIEIIIASIISMVVLLIRQKNLNLSNFDIEIKGYKILIITAVIEITAQFLFKRYTGNNILKFLSYYWIIYLAIFYVSLKNIKMNYMKSFFIGTLLNFIAISANNFKMPVLITKTFVNADKNILLLKSGQDLVHTLLTDSTKFKILCDIIILPPPYPFVKTISIGDIFLLIGIFLFWQESLFKTKSNLK